MKKASDYSIVSLLYEGIRELDLKPEELEKIVLNCIVGERQKLPNEKLDIYYQNLAHRLRDKIYSLMKEIKEKGKEYSLPKIQAEIEKNIEKKNIGSLQSWWGICYEWLFSQFNSYKKELEKSSKEKYSEKKLLQQFLSNCSSKKIIIKILLNNVAKKAGEIEMKEKKLKKIKEQSVEEILKKEYKLFVNTFLNVVRGFEKIEEIIQI